MWGPFVAFGADLGGCFGIDQVLESGLEHAPEDVGMGQVGIGEDFADQGR